MLNSKDLDNTVWLLNEDGKYFDSTYRKVLEWKEAFELLEEIMEVIDHMPISLEDFLNG